MTTSIEDVIARYNAAKTDFLVVQTEFFNQGKDPARGDKPTDIDTSFQRAWQVFEAAITEVTNRAKDYDTSHAPGLKQIITGDGEQIKKLKELVKDGNSFVEGKGLSENSPVFVSSTRRVGPVGPGNPQ